MSTKVAPGRRIGTRGTAARLVVGTAMIVGGAVAGITWRHVLVGLVAAPLVVLTFVITRGPRHTPVRFTGPGGHCVNCAIGVAAFVFLPVAALLFYGSSMLLAAARGYAGCELFAVSNTLLGRDDEIACPVFAPVDGLDGRSAACG